MRVLTLILVPATLGLWAYYLVLVAPLDAARPVAVRPDGAELSAATLNNEGVRLDRAGRAGDALAYLQRAQDFRPLDPVITGNVARQEARVRKVAWTRALGGGTAFVFALLVIAGLWHGVRGARDRARLARLRVAGDPWFVIPRDGEEAELPLRFTGELDGVLRRNPLTIVWSSAAHGKHMKSRPPVEARGRSLTVRLDRDRLARLQRYPGEWKGFLYLGGRPVGEAGARVV